MTVFRNAKVIRTCTLQNPCQAVQVNGHSAAWPLYTGDVTGPATALTIPNTSGILVTHNGGGAVIFRFGYDKTISVATHSGGMHHLPPGGTMLFDEAEMSAVGATWVAVASPGGGAKVTFASVTTQKLVTFESPADTADLWDAPNASGGGLAVGFISASFSSGTLNSTGTLQGTGYPT